MKCLYCHNPETQKLCNCCGACIITCPEKALKKINNRIEYDKNACISCDICIKNCPNYSSPKCIELEVEDLYRQISNYFDFIDGITLSGGECTLQHEFIIELFKKIKEQTKLTTFIDTNGYVDSEIFCRLCEVTDGFMFDLKALDVNNHIELTELDNKLVINNMSIASELGLLYEVRTVIVEGFTDEERTITHIADFIKNLNDYTIYKLIPYRPYGVRTYLADYLPIDIETYKKLYNGAHKILGARAREVVI